MMVLEDENDVMQAAVEAVVAANPESVRDLRSGDGRTMGFLLGQVMKMTGGHADPKTVQSMLRLAIERGAE